MYLRYTSIKPKFNLSVPYINGEPYFTTAFGCMCYVNKPYFVKFNKIGNYIRVHDYVGQNYTIEYLESKTRIISYGKNYNEEELDFVLFTRDELNFACE